MANQYLSIPDAICKAKRSIKWPSMAVMFIPWITVVLAGKLQIIPTVGNAGMYWFLPIFLGGFIAGWLVWSVRVPKWMLWAYPQVEDLSKLKEAAIAEQILWPDGSVFNRTLIMSRDDRRRLDRIERKSL